MGVKIKILYRINLKNENNAVAVALLSLKILQPISELTLDKRPVIRDKAEGIQKTLNEEAEHLMKMWREGKMEEKRKKQSSGT